jgi:hypothetical protein
VTVVQPGGKLRGTWKPAGLKQPEDIAVHEKDIWIVDAANRRVYGYYGAATRTKGSAKISTSFPLNAANARPTGLVTDGQRFWVTDDAAASVFVYDRHGSLLGSWQLDHGNTDPSGITRNPAGGHDLWVVDRADRLVYHDALDAKLTDGQHPADATFTLYATNAHPEGIADPPTSLHIPLDDKKIDDKKMGPSLVSAGDSGEDFSVINFFVNQPSGPIASSATFQAEGEESSTHQPQSPVGDTLLGSDGQVTFTTSEGTAVAAIGSPLVDMPSPADGMHLVAGQTLLLSGTAEAVTQVGPLPTPGPNRITAVLINGVAVDALDAAGNFFMQVDVLPGRNVFDVTAIDAYGQMASTMVSIFGDQTPGGNVDLLFDVSPSFAPLYARTSFDERHGMLFAELAIHNAGQNPADNPFYVGVRNISDPSVTMRDIAGRTRDGMPYHDFSPAVSASRSRPRPLPASSTPSSTTRIASRSPTNWSSWPSPTARENAREKGTGVVSGQHEHAKGDLLFLWRDDSDK